MVILSSFLIFIFTFLPGIYFYNYVTSLSVSKLKTRVFSAINDTVDGVFLGLGFFHMLPEMLEYADQVSMDTSISICVMIAVIILFATLSYVYRMLSRMPTDNEDDKLCLKTFTENKNTSLLLSAVVILSVHSVSEGVALGFFAQTDYFYLVFVAIALHKWLESFIVASAVQSYESTFISQLIICGFSLMTPLGLFIADFGLQSLMSQSNAFSYCLYTFSSALFIYIGISCIISSYKKEQNLTYRFIILGLSIILFFEYVVHHFVYNGFA